MSEATVEQKEATETQQENPNVIWIGATGFEADADQLCILVDEFRSGYECETCHGEDVRMITQGRQASVVPCKECNGKGERPKVGNDKIMVKCTACDARGVVPCPACNGTGGIIAIPDDKKPAVTTGAIVSIGPLVPAGKRVLGERVLFGSYAGSQYDVTERTDQGREKKVELRFLRDDEVKAKLYGRLKYRALKGARALHTNE